MLPAQVIKYKATHVLYRINDDAQAHAEELPITRGFRSHRQQGALIVGIEAPLLRKQSGPLGKRSAMSRFAQRAINLWVYPQPSLVASLGASG